jgi:hypothetical protein
VANIKNSTLPLFYTTGEYLILFPFLTDKGLEKTFMWTYFNIQTYLKENTTLLHYKYNLLNAF